MGKLILRNNGLETQLVNGIPFSGITPQNNTYYIGVDSESGLFSQLNSSGTTISIGSGSGSITVESVTYSGLTSLITTSGLTLGSYYLINDFRTCYDQPDFDHNGNPITTGNYKQGPVEPILVFATSNETISSNAYQPAYPNDKITYDWVWNLTEVTGGQAFGRITERIDEYNNRTDYDHRNILFKRYKLFTYREELRLNGTIELLNDGTINGINTSFTGLTVGDVIYIPNVNPSHYEVVNISSDILMSVSGDTIGTTGAGANFYRTIEETNDLSGYFSYKRTNVKTNDYIEYTTFGNAFLDSYAKNNYVGNYANNYTNIASGVFLLANNVFLEGEYESNKFGDYSFNNTWGTDNQNNVWGDYCYGNVSTNDIDGCIIGHYFYENLINTNLYNNIIGDNFYSNKLLAENNNSFEENTIGNNFNNNTIYSNFYRNDINYDFNSNFIGDYNNINNNNSEFYRNTIGINFNENNISREFQNNSIKTNFQANRVNGPFVGNTILNGFNNNTIGAYFNTNNIGNGFNNNTIYENFYSNKTEYYFNNNLVSYEFHQNEVGDHFTNNKPSNYSLFGWSDLSNVSTRTYSSLLSAVGGWDLQNRVLGKEFVMRIISTSQYFIIKFTKWTYTNNGGGFQYERTEISSSGGALGPTIIFNKTNYGNEVDVIVPGVVEITRNNGDDGIYNTITESSWNGSPGDTEWNSVYTLTNNGQYFGYNKIGNYFEYNVIGNYFGDDEQSAGNVIGDNFRDNTIGNSAHNNRINDQFQSNTVGDYFKKNQIKNYFKYNNIGNNFESNIIGDYFGNNSNDGSPITNTIFNNFKYNKIGNFFGNDLNYPGANTPGGNGGNIINDGFQYNVVGDNAIYNAIDLNFMNNKIGDNFWFNAFGQETIDNVIGNLFVGNNGTLGYPYPMGNNFLSNNIGNYAGFNVIESDFRYNKIGNFFGNAGIDTNNIIGPNFRVNNIGDYFGNDGSSTSGGNTIDIGFVGNTIVYGFNTNTVGISFKNNNIKTVVASTDFDQYRGNILTYGLVNSNGGVDSTYINLSGTTNGSGINATFDVVVAGGSVSSVLINNIGQYYLNGNIFTIDGSLIGGTTGVDDVSILINTVVYPSVYEDYNTEIFTRQDGTNRLSYYDSSDLLTITDINNE